METQEIKIENIVEVKPKTSWVRIFTVIAGIFSLIGGLVLIPAAMLGVGYGGSEVVFFIPFILIAGSIGMFMRKKWSIYLLTIFLAFLYYKIFSKGFKFEIGPYIALELIIICGPIALILYFWLNKDQFK